ncbi:methyltransferase domain-containing protein [Actinoplanes sp. CA-030573]|uniref:class I SAM-dependent methyltransferase n=1 Tax=Actinoplanes sp. CA-030573 TaxID=3239898 RepID=UPI003D8DA01C
MIYQNPLHYLLGLEGLALLRAYGGDYDQRFAEERVAEIRRLLAEPGLAGDGVSVGTVDTKAGYRIWSRTYDRPGNGLFPIEEPFVHEIVDAIPPGVALDAACGTGRHTAYLAGRGHRVIGVDSSPDMLAHARERVPGAEFHEAPLDALPLPDEHVDLAVCALALAHLPDLRPAFAELARVLRPGGSLVVTDIHHEIVLLGSVPHVRTDAGEPRLIPSYRHRASDYLGAALPAGLELRRLEEPRNDTAADIRAPMAAAVEAGEWDMWPWTLMGQAPAARGGAFDGTPGAVLWHFRKLP